MRVRRAAMVLGCVLGTVLSGASTPVFRASADPVAMAAGSEERPDEASAAAAARESGQPVLVSGLRSETTEVVANPDGTFTATVNPVPVRVVRDGGWVPVDTTLVFSADGTVSPVATAEPMVLSGGGSQPLVRLGGGGGQFSVSWPAALPVPTLWGDTATYSDVLPGVDLVVRVTADGFSDFLVVRDATAAENPALSTLRFGLSTSGVSFGTDASGEVRAVDAAGEVVFVAPPARMWDSAEVLQPQVDGVIPDPGVHQAEVDVQVAGGELALTPDQAMFTAADTNYPVVIDPSFTATRSSWTKVFAQFPTTSYWNGAIDGSEAKVGHSDQDNVTVRSLFTMGTSLINGKQILSAQFQVQETHSWSCDARPVELWETGGISSSTTWNSQPAWLKKLNTQTVAKGWRSQSVSASDALISAWSSTSAGVLNPSVCRGRLFSFAAISSSSA